MAPNSSNDDDSDDSPRDDLVAFRMGGAVTVKREDTPDEKTPYKNATADAIGSGAFAHGNASEQEHERTRSGSTKMIPSRAIATIIMGTAAATPPSDENEKPEAVASNASADNSTAGALDALAGKQEPKKMASWHVALGPTAVVEIEDDSSDDDDSMATEVEDSSDEKSEKVDTDAVSKAQRDADILRAVAETMVQNASWKTEKPSPATATATATATTEAKRPPKINPRNSCVGKESFKKMELDYKHQTLAQADQLRFDQLRSTQFPFRLHNMLDDAEPSGHSHIVSWCKGGDSFRIHKPAELITVLQKYFRQSKFKSFLRQLQGYNFKRVTRGKDQGVVSHPLFLKGRRSLSTYMKRKRAGPKVNDMDTSDTQKVAALSAASEVFPGSETKKMTSSTGYGVAGNPSSSLQLAPSLTNTAASRLCSSAPASSSNVVSIAMAINPAAHDVLCVDVPNVENFQGNRNLASIVQKIVGHYTAANESVKTMIVNEISTRIKKGGSRFLRLTHDGMSWMECNQNEIFRKVVDCFDDEIRAGKKSNHVDLTGYNKSDAMSPGDSASYSLAGRGAHATSESAQRQDPPREQDVVLRGGPSNAKEGNRYLITMILANVGHQQESAEMKRIKCRAILERMKRRGSRFFLKLNEIEADDEMYLLSDAEAQEVIYTAFCAEEKKVQSVVNESQPASASSLLQRQALAGIDGLHSGHLGLGNTTPQLAALGTVQQQSDAALLSHLRAKNDMGVLSMQASLKRPLETHGSLSTEDIIEKRLRAETDERMKLLLERAQQRRNEAFGASGLTGGLAGVFNARNALLESSLPSSFYGGGSNEMTKLLNERRAEDLLLKSAVARNAFTTSPSAAELRNTQNRFVEFLKKKYNGQERGW